MMPIYYENSMGVKLDLLREPYKVQTGDIFNYSWSYQNNGVGYGGGSSIKFSKEVVIKNITLTVLASSIEFYYEALNHFFETVEYDVIHTTPGKMWVGNQYLLCNIYASTKTEWEYGIESLDNSVSLVTDYPFWITEQKYAFLKQEDDSISELDEANELERGIIVPEFKWDFAKWSDVKRIENKSISASDFVMTIYGYALNPKVMIAGHPYSVEAEILIGERLVIDSKKPSVQKIGRFGEVTNLWNAREKNYSVFQKIPSGYVTMNWTGSFGVDLTIYDERSEPKWSL